MPKPPSQQEVAQKLVAELLPGVSVEVLMELHLLPREGRLNAEQPFASTASRAIAMSSLLPG